MKITNNDIGNKKAFEIVPTWEDIFYLELCDSCVLLPLTKQTIIRQTKNYNMTKKRDIKWLIGILQNFPGDWMFVKDDGCSGRSIDLRLETDNPTQLGLES